MINNIDIWGLADQSPGTPLGKIFPISKRAACLVVRNESKPLLKTNFLNIQGAVEMLKGLDYHHDHFMDVIGQLAGNGMHGNNSDLKCALLHEAMAYLNRLGQFFYFLKSPFVKKHCANAESLVPTIVKYIVFRHKTVHRSLDKPRKESKNVQEAQAMSMSAFGGTLFQPKPGKALDFSQVKTVAAAEVYWQHIYIDSYLTFQLITNDRNVFHNFSIEKEHQTIMQEAYSVLEQLLK